MPITVRINGRERPNLAFRIPEQDITQGDLLWVGQTQRTTILRKTERGVDVDNRPFAKYSEKGPFYWYPGARTKSRSRVRSARAMAKRLGLTETAAGLSRRSTPFGGVTPGGGIKYRSYGDFKRSLGRSNPDLRGARAPHMLQQLVVRAPGREIRGNQARPGPEQQTQRGRQSSVGIYGGEAAQRATGHQVGARRLPQRRFVGATRAEVQSHARMLLRRVGTRLRSDFRRL